MTPDVSVFETTDDDEDIFVLEKLLATAENCDTVPKPTHVPESTPSEQEDDADIYALDRLLGESEEPKEQAIETQQSIKNVAPKLREDESFAEAFSYTIDPAVNNRAEQYAAASAEKEDLDSSDDEEVRNFLERKYNEYGSDINKKLKDQRHAKREAAITKDVVNSIKNESSTNDPHKPVQRKSHITTSNSFKKTSTPDNTTTPKNVITNYFNEGVKQTVCTDPVFGLKIVNPVISSSMLVERMSGKQAIPFLSLAFHTQRGDLSKDWVIAGVVISKSSIKTTKTGTPYSIWRLSDLKADIKKASIFLFKSAHKDLWKTAEGTVIAVLNPSVFDKRSQTDDVACLSIDSSQKIMILGRSKDFGVCKANKKDGNPCTAIVNLSECDFCVFHIKQEFSKMSQRSELQSSTSGRGLNELRNKVLGKSEVFYGGQSYTAIPAKKSAKLAMKDAQRLMSLSEYAVSPNARDINHAPSQKRTDPVPYAVRGGPVSKLAGSVDVNRQQRLKDLERLKQLQENNSKSDKTSETTPPQFKEKDSSIDNSNKSQSFTPTPSESKFSKREFSFTLKKPQLSRENFCIEVSVDDKKAYAARLKAIQALKERPVEKSNPNFVKYRGTLSGKRRAIDELNEKMSSETKRQKIDENQKDIDRRTRIQRIMDASSSHTNLVESRELEEQEKYFNKLEKKEALEEKMLQTFKVPCKAVICVQCKYTAFSAADRCKEQRHTLKVIDTEKRFFQCKDCGNRTATVHKLPKMSCKNCQSSRWVRAAMIRDRKVDDGREKLSIRGDEETFMGTITNTANINLLVPE